ncbi:MAG TPA: transglycosylase family protein, partial [Frankiaceae bacterium]|nr:transglycosylase family protein [Frankiaceae bacterium]
MTSTRFHTTKRAGAVALALAAGSTGLIAATTGSASASSLDWNKVAQCESGGNWNANTGNSYKGGLQFSSSTWQAYGGSGDAASASPSQQMAVADRV